MYELRDHGRIVRQEVSGERAAKRGEGKAPSATDSVSD